jgi:hypothetical protein
MDFTLFERFAPVIRSLSPAELKGAPSLNGKLRLASHETVEVCYAPFEYINSAARIVIVGITPGRTQMLNALAEARRQLDGGASPLEVLLRAKQSAAFSGDMRPNLVNLLNHVGVNRWLGIRSCDELFGTAAHLAQTTSVLRNPVFIAGRDYNGTPKMTGHPLLRKQLMIHFAEDVKQLPGAVFLPLGDKVVDTLHFMASQGVIDGNRILDGVPHPSPQNVERIAYFLGRKERNALSIKTNPEKLDQARARMIEKVKALA